MMEYGICRLTVLPVRSLPSEKEEMVNQLLFGEEFTVLEIKKDWIYIKGEFDGYKGWIDRKGTIEISSDTFKSIKANSNSIVINSLNSIITKNGSKQYLLPGSTIPNYNKGNQEFSIENEKFFIDKLPECENKPVTPPGVIKTARIYMNAPYLWGGRSLFGIDCSGFTQVVYKINGIQLPRDASQQEKEGKLIQDLNEAGIGDLAFFKNDKGKTTHTGIISENNQIIHASGMVRIDRFDKEGIYNEEIKAYTHKFKSIRRIYDSSIKAPHVSG